MWLRIVLAAALSVPAGAAAAEGLILLVRHAEKVDDSPGSDLTGAGRARAEALAEMLRDAEIEAVYSTDFRRTRETARPLAEALGLEVELYDGSKLAELAERLESAGRRTAVVGHSNTTPELVRLLGGNPGEPIAEDEYDRLYVVAPGGETLLIRYAP